jgi:endoglucanase
MNKPVLCGALMLLAAQTACQAQSDITNAVKPASTIASSGASGSFGIKVSGNKLVSSADGSTVQIIGANISGLETGSASLWPQFASAGAGFWSKVKNWDGAPINTVRLPLNEASWLNYTCYDPGAGASAGFYAAAKGGGYTPDPKGEYQSIVRQAVADATAAGLYVILDLHWGSPNNSSGQPLCPIGQPAYADADHSLTFWKQVADSFKSNPAVVFELFNEPFGSNVYGNWIGGADQPGKDAITLRDGGSFSPLLEQNNSKNNVMLTYNFSWRVAGMQAMLDTIRGAGATNVILSSPIGWAGEIQAWLAAKPTDPLNQLGVAWHVYGYKKGTAPPLAVLAAGFPIVITETYGLGAIGGYDWAASQNIGYLWWGWNDWGGRALNAELSRPPWYRSTAP